MRSLLHITTPSIRGLYAGKNVITMKKKSLNKEKQEKQTGHKKIKNKTKEEKRRAILHDVEL